MRGQLFTWMTRCSPSFGMQNVTWQTLAYWECVGSRWSVAHFYVSLWWDGVHHRKIVQRNNSWTPLADAVLCMELHEDYDKVSCWKLLLIKVIQLNTCWMPRTYSICQGCGSAWKCCLGWDPTIKRCKYSFTLHKNSFDLIFLLPFYCSSCFLFSFFFKHWGLIHYFLWLLFLTQNTVQS